jgi:hypothetical protein
VPGLVLPGNELVADFRPILGGRNDSVAQRSVPVALIADLCGDRDPMELAE